jgi:hypothetical protein
MFKSRRSVFYIFYCIAIQALLPVTDTSSLVPVPADLSSLQIPTIVDPAIKHHLQEVVSLKH